MLLRERQLPESTLDSVYTPALDTYLPSLVPGIKTVYKDLRCLGPISMLFEHIYGFLAETKRRKAVLNNSKGTLHLKTRSETAKTLLQAASVGNASRSTQFFRGRTTSFKTRGSRWGGASRGFQCTNTFNQFRGSFRGQGRSARGALHQVSQAS